MKTGDLIKLMRILGMLGSDSAGERAAAALAADRHMKRLGLTWGQLLSRPAGKPGRIEVVRTVYEWGIDHARAAESRMRQLRLENERLRKELAKARLGIAIRRPRGL